MWYLIIYVVGCIIAYLIAARINDNNEYSYVKLPAAIIIASWFSIIVLLITCIPSPTLKRKRRK